MAIFVTLKGGLGNQLFQYATARCVSNEQNDPEIIFNTSYYWYVRNRKFLLDQFKIKGRVARPWEYLFIALNYGMNAQVFKEKKLFQLPQIISRTSGNVYMDGFWQHKAIPEKIKDILQRELDFRIPISATARKYLTQIQKSDAVMVHVRRRDYLRPSAGFELCGMKYYIESFKYLITKLENPVFFIFSDDLEWCRVAFSAYSNVVFVENCKNEIEELQLMSVCKHAVIANSTFSWWGAWLIRNSKKMVLAPEHWMQSNKYSDEAMLLSTWKKMKTI